MRKVIFWVTLMLLTIVAIPGCDEQSLQRADAIVQDVNTIGEAADAVLKSPAGQSIPPDWRLYGALGVAVINGLGLTWAEWRSRQMKKTTKAIVQGIENASNPDKEPSDVKAHIKKEMLAAGGPIFYAKANRLVDQLKVK